MNRSVQHVFIEHSFLCLKFYSLDASMLKVSTTAISVHSSNALQVRTYTEYAIPCLATNSHMLFHKPSYTIAYHAYHPTISLQISILHNHIQTSSYSTLHRIIPPTFLSTHSLASITPLSVLTKTHSPTLFNPSTLPSFLPLTNFSSP